MRSPRPWDFVLVLHAFSHVHSSFAASALDPNSTLAGCSCYRATGDTRALFLHHQFFDFRALDNDTLGLNFTAPVAVDDSQDAGIEPITSPFFGRGQFGDYFTPASWSKNASEASPVSLVNSQQNIYLARDSPDSPVHLTLRTNRLTSFQSTSDLETTELAYLHASMRIRARISGSSGACAGMFTYHSDDQESDIEILTRDDQRTMRATNQPGVDPQGQVIPEASTPINIPSADGSNGSWTDWNIYQLNWLPGQSEWFINGIGLVNKTYGVPTEASNFQIKMWSDGSPWTGNMSVGGLATLDIEWIDMVYNTSADAPGGKCNKICTVDGIENNPVPQVAEATVRVPRMGMILALMLGGFWVMVLLT
ncbi:MAG: hypothetical protein Q9220_001399 [cf. Caloplaca sp. 1 TL-2023]